MRFIAYWNKGKEHCNIKITNYEVMNMNVVLLYQEEALIGWFDLGTVDIWYVSNEERNRT